MTIAGQIFTVSQSAPGSCTYSISPTSQQFPVGGGAGSVSVTAGSGCSWSVVNNNPEFITVSPPTSGTGNGTVNYSVAANSGGLRSGTMTIAGQTFTVGQDGSVSIVTPLQEFMNCLKPPRTDERCPLPASTQPYTISEAIVIGRSNVTATGG